MIHRIIGGINYKPRATRVLKEIVRKTDSLSGGLICGYSITDTENGVFAADAILVSDQGQTTIIDVAEGRELGEYQERQDWGFNLIVGTLQANPRLMEGRRLRVHTRTLTFAPELEVGDETDPEHPVITKKGLIHFLERCQAAQEAAKTNAIPHLAGKCFR